MLIVNREENSKKRAEQCLTRFSVHPSLLLLRVLANEPPGPAQGALGAPAVVEPNGSTDDPVSEAVAILERQNLGHGIPRAQLHASIGEPVGDRGDHPIQHHQIEVKHNDSSLLHNGASKHINIS